VAANGFSVDPDQLRLHARNVDTQRERLGAVKAASAHIAQNDAAYGLLCKWIAAVLEGRHSRQDELIAGVEENLIAVAEVLRRTADTYESTDAESAQGLNEAAGGLGR
jgi:hypothetical protein